MRQAIFKGCVWPVCFLEINCKIVLARKLVFTGQWGKEFLAEERALEKGWGAWGKVYENAFPSERLGPLAPAATGWRPQAVPVATQEATGIDSRDEGFPSPQHTEKTFLP